MNAINHLPTTRHRHNFHIYLQLISGFLLIFRLISHVGFFSSSSSFQIRTNQFSVLVFFSPLNKLIDLITTATATTARCVNRLHDLNLVQVVLGQLMHERFIKFYLQKLWVHRRLWVSSFKQRTLSRSFSLSECLGWQIHLRDLFSRHFLLLPRLFCLILLSAFLFHLLLWLMKPVHARPRPL